MEDRSKHIDDLFREGLGDYQETPGPGVWEKLEQRLPAAGTMPATEPPSKKWGWYLLLLLLLLGTVGYFILRKSAENTTLSKPINQQTQQKADSVTTELWEDALEEDWENLPATGQWDNSGTEAGDGISSAKESTNSNPTTQQFDNSPTAENPPSGPKTITVNNSAGRHSDISTTTARRTRGANTNTSNNTGTQQRNNSPAEGNAAPGVNTNALNNPTNRQSGNSATARNTSPRANAATSNNSPIQQPDDSTIGGNATPEVIRNTSNKPANRQSDNSATARNASSRVNANAHDNSGIQQTDNSTMGGNATPEVSSTASNNSMRRQSDNSATAANGTPQTNAPSGNTTNNYNAVPANDNRTVNSTAGARRNTASPQGNARAGQTAISNRDAALPATGTGNKAASAQSGNNRTPAASNDANAPAPVNNLRQRSAQPTTERSPAAADKNDNRSTATVAASGRTGRIQTNEQPGAVPGTGNRNSNTTTAKGSPATAGEGWQRVADGSGSRILLTTEIDDEEEQEPGEQQPLYIPETPVDGITDPTQLAGVQPASKSIFPTSEPAKRKSISVNGEPAGGKNISVTGLNAGAKPLNVDPARFNDKQPAPVQGEQFSKKGLMKVSSTEARPGPLVKVSGETGNNNPTAQIAPASFTATSQGYKVVNHQEDRRSATAMAASGNRTIPILAAGSTSEERTSTQVISTGNGGGGGGGSSEMPQRKFPRLNQISLEGGIKAGYEQGLSSYSMSAPLIAPYLQWNVSPKLGFMLMPTFRYNKINMLELYAQTAYHSIVTQVRDSNHVLDTAQGLNMIQRNYYYKSTYDSILAGYKVEEQKFWEIDVPILLTYKLSPRLSMLVGPYLTFGNMIQINADIKRYNGLTREDTLRYQFVKDSSNVPGGSANYPHPPGVDEFFSYNTPAYPGTAPDDGRNPATNPARFGLMFGLSFEMGKRVVLDLLMRQNLSDMRFIPNDKVRKAYTTPYIRATVGIKLFETARPVPKNPGGL